MSQSMNEPHYETWMNSVVLQSIYSFLPFWSALNFRLVNTGFNQELSIAFGMKDDLLLQIRKIKQEESHLSLLFIHGGILRVNAEIRNLEMKEKRLIQQRDYSSLFKEGVACFDSWIERCGIRHHSGTSKMKIKSKRDGEDFVTFTQRYFYNNTASRIEFYSLKMKDQVGLYEIQSMFCGKDLEAIEDVISYLDIPQHWNMTDFLRFLMESSMSLNDNVIESMLNAEQTYFDPSDPAAIMAEEREGEAFFSEILKTLTDSSRKLNSLEIIRDILIRIASRKSQHLFIDNSKKSAELKVDQRLLEIVRSKLSHFTKRERVLFGTFNVGSHEETIDIEAKFKVDDKTVRVRFHHYKVYLPSYTAQTKIIKDQLILKLNHKPTNLFSIYHAIVEQKYLERNELLEFAEIILLIIGKCFSLSLYPTFYESTTVPVTAHFEIQLTKILERLVDIDLNGNSVSQYSIKNYLV